MIVNKQLISLMHQVQLLKSLLKQILLLHLHEMMHRNPIINLLRNLIISICIARMHENIFKTYARTNNHLLVEPHLQRTQRRKITIKNQTLSFFRFSTFFRQQAFSSSRSVRLRSCIWGKSSIQEKSGFQICITKPERNCITERKNMQM